MCSHLKFCNIRCSWPLSLCCRPGPGIATVPTRVSTWSLRDRLLPAYRWGEWLFEPPLGSHSWLTKGICSSGCIDGPLDHSGLLLVRRSALISGSILHESRYMVGNIDRSLSFALTDEIDTWAVCSFRLAISYSKFLFVFIATLLIQTPISSHLCQSSIL